MSDLELWGGIECSVVRVRDAYVDQVELTGHAQRPDDLDRLAALGARAVRYPVLWERTEPEPGGELRWGFADERLARMRALGLRPIAGLVHHGSGPRHTSLLHDSFVTGLAEHGRRVAERYPWVLDYTPVNEPLTTARFSALYGHWYPHARSDREFVRALLVECLGTREAMRAIRTVTPGARLVQTEDLGTIFSTKTLAYQAAFENERRFMSLDLLCGRIDREHPMRGFLEHHGAPPDVLDSFVADPCPPDILGLNHYVTSDRFLDEDVAKYPAHVRGGNGRHRYADVEAVRVLGAGIPGHGALARVLWERYRLPIALTEVHLGCTPEEQIRWLAEAWKGVDEAKREGVDVRAVTPWSVFGACDWDSLLTNPRGHYEPGLFDVRGGPVRPTALASVARDLAARGASDHPMLEEPGWWRREARLLYPSFGRVVCATSPGTRRPILVTGARGTLARAIGRVAEARGLSVMLMARPELDIADAGSVRAALDAHRPWAVVNAAGYVRVDDAETDRAACIAANGTAAVLLAEACASRGIRFATFSSDLVFDGQKAAPYVESDAARPLNVYGESKAFAERRILEAAPSSLVVRTSAFFGPWDEANFVVHALSALAANQPFVASRDAVVSPTYVPDLAEAVLTLLVDGGAGIWHVATPGALTWFDLAARAADLAGVQTGTLLGKTTAELGLAAARPLYSVLGSERGALMPALDDALARFIAARRPREYAETG